MARRPRTTTSPTLTVAETAAALRCCPDTIRAAVRRGELPAVRIGRVIRIPAAAITATTTAA